MSDPETASGEIAPACGLAYSNRQDSAAPGTLTVNGSRPHEKGGNRMSWLGAQDEYRMKKSD